jgi:hypothetical protein
MTQHDDDPAARAEQETDRLEERTDALGEQIQDTRDDWERKKADSKVPGAAGDPERAEGDLPPEANYTTRGD